MSPCGWCPSWRRPIRQLVAAGVTVTVNTDDPPMFATDLNAEYAIAARLLELDEAGVADLARAAVTASFASAETKSRLTAEIDAYAATIAPVARHAGCLIRVQATAPARRQYVVTYYWSYDKSLEQRGGPGAGPSGLTRPPATDGTELPADPDLWLLHELKATTRPTPSCSGTATAEGPVAWQRGRTHRPGDGADWEPAAAVLDALSHPVRLRLLQRVLNGTATTAELAEDDSLGTTGQLHHHLRALVAAGWLTSTGRGRWSAGPRVIPLLVVVVAASTR